MTAEEKKDFHSLSTDETRLQELVNYSGKMCHDFNQPIQSMLFRIDLLLKDVKEDEKASGRATKIKRDVHSLADLVDQLAVALTPYRTNR